jgi:hypothetical protein
VWEIDFPGGISNDNIKWRAMIWAISEALLVVAIAINRLPPRLYSTIFKFSMVLMIVDMLLCMIWLPIGASRTYGLRTASEVFTQTCEFLCTSLPYIPLSYTTPHLQTMGPEPLLGGIGFSLCM